MNDASSSVWSRRDFLRVGVSAAAGVAAGSALPGCVTTSEGGFNHPLIGTQLYGWGQYYDRDHRKLTEHLDEALGAVRDCGFDYAEGWFDGVQPENNERFAAQLRARGLQPVSLYTGAPLHEERKAGEAVDRILAAAGGLARSGYRVLVCNPDPIGREKTDAELVIQVAALKRLGAGLRKAGVSLGVHHHTPEMRSGAREFHYNFRNSAAGVVDFCYDVHWVYRGGLMPIETLQAYGDRVVTWHLRQSRQQVWWEDMDEGDVDYPAVARYIRAHRLPRLLTVELALEGGTKITRTVVENHRRSRDYVHRVFVASRELRG